MATNLIILLSALVLCATAEFEFNQLPRASKSCNSTSSCGCQNGRDGRDGRDGQTIQGPAGRDGKDGNDGRDCIDCARGPKGDKGDAGPPGKSGAAGKAGPAGPKGVKGDKGANGAKGDKGSAGPKGAPGPKGDKGVCDQTTLITMQTTIKTLRTDLASVTNELKTTKETLSKFNSQFAALNKAVSEMKKTTVQVGRDHKIAHSLLPAGYSDYAANELQWQSLHMAAAACCRAVTATGGSGSHPNRVYPRTKNMNCNQVCQATLYTSCDAEMSIYGSVKKASSQKDEVGWFSNHGCDDKGSYGFEPMVNPSDVFKPGTFISFCCCR